MSSNRIALIGSSFDDALATEFNGTNQYAYVDDPSFKADTQGCFALRVNATTVFPGGNGVEPWISYGVKTAGNNARVFMAKRRDGSAGTDTRFEQSSRLTHNGTINTIQSTTLVSAAQWYSLVHQSNDTAYSIYVDGVVEALNIVTGSNNGGWLGDLTGTNHRLAFGCFFNANAASLFNDCILNECIYMSRPMTSTEVTEWNNGGTTSNPHRLSFINDIVSWWRFGDSRDDATTVFDEIGSNDLILVNSPSYVAAP